ncbi:hypothetical protein [Bradyrhizobium sp. RDI18]|uniref:hypothetical protein n=1 Tax=Bradyrhizobium sp. RDI18 TaxID=3367400 RepID=UPI00371BAD3A
MSRRFELLVARDHTAADRLVIAPVELPFMGERENVSREVQMVDVVGFLMVIAAYMALPNDGVWAVGRLIANKLERRQIVLLFNSKTSGKTAPQPNSRDVRASDRASMPYRCSCTFYRRFA